MGGHSSGSYPAMPVHKGGAADNKVLWIVLGVVAAIALIVIIAVAMSGDDESGGGGGGSGGGTAEYTAAEEQEFMDACVPGAGDAVCTCAWTGITESISYERFVEIETELRELGADVAPEDLPQDLVSIMTECAGAS